MRESNISWTDYTWNPWIGCRKVSAACKFCYMYRTLERNGSSPAHVFKNVSQFNKPLFLK
ncbi:MULTISPECIES: DUF5131 family protein [Flagellimonas]|uniref:DUF5131 family protein n=1 Tax=Flagellimonas chongwuensis TaxID=2697365 RepID=A0A850NI42_9FLAO|nr:DUF5131 family protein [Allomuricauda chongwuensis]